MAHAQSAASSTSKCGPEAWSTDKMTYVGVPCPGGQGGTSSASNCGPETWSTDKMAYVGVPCSTGQTPGTQQASAPTSLQYCNELVARYDQYLNKGGKSGGMQSANAAANVAAAKCRAGDASDISALEGALRDARIALPPHS
ncbi:hypothetical protein [Enhydrobacter aerosaccus]|uniref:hypothetical protein n=1 Tax=Enhydrobacter aerosaccus TaxID=225324 RepID=UPI001117A9DC|nr:hypothetical protein [Enhydrobacter aerosaccus]